MSEPGAFAVITGGGTAGHVLPALAIAEALVDAGHDPSTLHYVGAQRGIETRLLAGTPGQWRELVPAQTAATSIVSITPAPATANAPHSICAIASDGTTYFTDGRVATEIDEF